MSGSYLLYFLYC